jgi:hypothetical protein
MKTVSQTNGYSKIRAVETATANRVVVGVLSEASRNSNVRRIRQGIDITRHRRSTVSICSLQRVPWDPVADWYDEQHVVGTQHRQVASSHPGRVESIRKGDPHSHQGY